MSHCVNWLLDPRLHLVLVASVLASVVVGDHRWLSADSVVPPEVESYFNRATLVLYQDGTTSRHVPDPDGLESAGDTTE
ncbi:hypothetical protein [Tautonia plasticadhaerens]|uniref:Uncharacterized protein n=1 Tax=Tautonia plasticadhaerens TaxID=2527974 RepID=A0A518HEA2_9BACT|nr:hypothetical protein [Tautonia plasticadhaerens]QDV39076.1 hypothetical protein ElP_70390 [Tautonia plasticadhaerens]